jgi:hypothetical protein
VGVAFLPLEHHVTPAGDDPDVMLVLLSFLTIVCQSTVGVDGALQLVPRVKRKTPHLALGAGGACIAPESK